MKNVIGWRGVYRKIPNDQRSDKEPSMLPGANVHRSRPAFGLLSRCQRRGPERRPSNRAASLHMEDGPMMMKIIDLLILILRLALVILDQTQ